MTNGPGVEATTAPAQPGSGGSSPDGAGGEREPGRKGSWFRAGLSPRRIGALYVLILIIVGFSLIDSARFPTWQTFHAILDQGAVTGLVSLALVVPLACGMYDLSVGATLSLGCMVGAVLLTETSMSVWLVILCGVLVGVVVGLLNALVTVVVRIDSLIGTLGTGAIIGSLSIAVSGNRTVTGPRVSGEFADVISGGEIAGVDVLVVYVVVAMIVLGLLLEQTELGRYWYAIGFEKETARLAGIRVALLQTVSFMISGALSAFAGLVLLGRLSSGQPGVGDPYLLTAFAAVFLGATQFRSGRFNAWGTILAVVLVATANYGLVLSQAPQWLPQTFTGVILLVAVGLTSTDRSNRIRQLRTRPFRRIESAGPQADD